MFNETTLYSAFLLSIVAAAALVPVVRLMPERLRSPNPIDCCVGMCGWRAWPNEDEYPDYKLDGTPMIGGIDIRGRPYGRTDAWADDPTGHYGSIWEDDSDSTSHSHWRPDDSFGFTSPIWEPVVNIDGTPMIGDIDIHWNPYGITS